MIVLPAIRSTALSTPWRRKEEIKSLIHRPALWLEARRKSEPSLLNCAKLILDQVVHVTCRAPNPGASCVRGAAIAVFANTGHSVVTCPQAARMVMRKGMKRILFLSVALAAALVLSRGAESEEGFVSIMDGKTFKGWKIAEESAKSWKIEDGAFVANGQRSHLYYVGDEKPFKDFELKVDVMTEPSSNGGIYFHTKWQESSWPKYGFECQVNVTQGDWIKTGSLYGLASIGVTPAQDKKWWTQHIIVKGNKVVVKIDDKTVLEYNEPAGTQPGKDFTRKLDEGTFALQAHDPKSVVRYKNIRVKRL
jgi:hypothetical protein